MNRILTIGVIAGGLLLAQSPEAAAHQEIRRVHAPFAHAPSYYRFEARRIKPMPAWLRSNKSFKRWYRHSRLKRNKRVSWHQLYRIYRWDRIQSRTHRHSRYYAARRAY